MFFLAEPNCKGPSMIDIFRIRLRIKANLPTHRSVTGVDPTHHAGQSPAGSGVGTVGVAQSVV
jgi:hypothetical protein